MSKKDAKNVISSYRKKQKLGPYILGGIAIVLAIVGIVLLIIYLVGGGDGPKISLFSSKTPTPTETPTPTPVTPTSTATMTATATNTPTITPTQVVLSPTPVPPTLTPTPIPGAVTLAASYWEKQGPNNCGPATLSIYLHYYGWDGDQKDITDLIKPVSEDRNVNPEELVYFVRTRAGWLNTEFRVGGDIDLMKKLLAAGEEKIFTFAPVRLWNSYNPDNFTLELEVIRRRVNYL